MSPHPRGQPQPFAGLFVTVMGLAFLGVGILVPLGEHLYGLKVDGTPSAKVIGPIAFTLFGIGCLWLGIRIFRGNIPGARVIPSAVPTLAHPTSSVSGKIRLEATESDKKELIRWFCLSVIWNLFSWTFLIAALILIKPSPPILLLALSGVFVLFGLYFIYMFIRTVLLLLMTGRTYLLASSHTLTPGERLTIVLHQAGKFSISRLTMNLICMEKATNTDGDGSSVKKEIIQDIPLCELKDLEAQNGQMLTQQTVTIPHDAMHSFHAPHNEINWLINVKMRLKGRPDIDRSFAIRVISPDALILEESS